MLTRPPPAPRTRTTGRAPRRAPDLRRGCFRPAVTVRISLYNVLNHDRVDACPLLLLPSWMACLTHVTCTAWTPAARPPFPPGRCSCSGTPRRTRRRGTWRWRRCGSWGSAAPRSLREGTAGLIRPLGRPRQTGEASWEQARAWRADGVRDAEIARRLGVNQATVLRRLGPAH